MKICETKEWIADVFLQLLKTKDYHDITISNIADKAFLGRRTFYRYFKSKNEVVEFISLKLVDEFTELLLQKQSKSFDEIMQSYFEFWEINIEVFLLLKKSRLLYFLEDNLIDLVTTIALKVGHIPADMENPLGLARDHRYEFGFKLAGFWKVTLIWSEEMPRKSPKEMSQIIREFLNVIR